MFQKIVLISFLLMSSRQILSEDSVVYLIEQRQGAGTENLRNRLTDQRVARDRQREDYGLTPRTFNQDARAQHDVMINQTVRLLKTIIHQKDVDESPELGDCCCPLMICLGTYGYTGSICEASAMTAIVLTGATCVCSPFME